MTADEQIKALREATRKAEKLAGIASDCNLQEVEIDGELVDVYDLRNEFRQALAATEGDGWRSMESAPRAWKSILLYEEDSGRNDDVGEGFWDGIDNDPLAGLNCWTWADGSKANPSKWKPLPAPPTDAEDA